MQHRILKDITGALNLEAGSDPGNAGVITVDRFNQYVELETAGAETRTVSQPTNRGLTLMLAMMTDGGACTVTVTGGFDEAGNTTLTFNDVGQFVYLVSVPVANTPTYQWRVVGYDGVAGPTVDFGAAVFSSITTGTVTINDGANIVVDTTTGTEIGTAAAQKIAFHGATPVDQAAALTAQETTVTHTAPSTADYAIQALTQSTPFGFVTADEGHTVLQVIANLQARMAEVETALVDKGLVAAS